MRGIPEYIDKRAEIESRPPTDIIEELEGQRVIPGQKALVGLNSLAKKIDDERKEQALHEVRNIEIIILYLTNQAIQASGAFHQHFKTSFVGAGG